MGANISNRHEVSISRQGILSLSRGEQNGIAAEPFCTNVAMKVDLNDSAEPYLPVKCRIHQ